MLVGQIPDKYQHDRHEYENKVTVPAWKDVDIGRALGDEGLDVDGDTDREIEQYETIEELLPAMLKRDPLP